MKSLVQKWAGHGMFQAYVMGVIPCLEASEADRLATATAAIETRPAVVEEFKTWASGWESAGIPG